jgi:hypothetical protein
MGKPVLYVVKSVIPAQAAEAFNDWYHNKHIPEILHRSGCRSARRFKALEAEDEYIFMAVYEFGDEAAFLAYQGSEAKKYLVGDFQERFGGQATLRTSVWEQIYP